METDSSGASRLLSPALSEDLQALIDEREHIAYSDGVEFARQGAVVTALIGAVCGLLTGAVLGIVLTVLVSRPTCP